MRSRETLGVTPEDLGQPVLELLMCFGLQWFFRSLHKKKKFRSGPIQYGWWSQSTNMDILGPEWTMLVQMGLANDEPNVVRNMVVFDQIVCLHMFWAMLVQHTSTTAAVDHEMDNI